MGVLGLFVHFFMSKRWTNFALHLCAEDGRILYHNLAAQELFRIAQGQSVRVFELLPESVHEALGQ